MRGGVEGGSRVKGGTVRGCEGGSGEVEAGEVNDEIDAMDI